MKTLALTIALIATGCATIDTHTPAPATWPELKVRDNIVSAWGVQRHCYGYVPLWQKALGVFPLACAEINFDARTCDIWRAYDATPDMLEHDHCAGRDHPGESTLRDAWQAHLQQATK